MAEKIDFQEIADAGRTVNMICDIMRDRLSATIVPDDNRTANEVMNGMYKKLLSYSMPEITLTFHLLFGAIFQSFLVDTGFSDLAAPVDEMALHIVRQAIMHQVLDVYKKREEE